MICAEETMAYKIGIPRSLLYYKYFSMWDAFFKELGVETIVSKPTGKKVLNRGLEVAENELCLPIKAFFGHVLSLAEQVEGIFVPRVVSVDADGYTCPKLLGLPDMSENLVKDLRLQSKTEVVAPIVDLTDKKDWNSALEQTGMELGFDHSRAKKATKTALKAQKDFYSKLQQGLLPPEIFAGRSEPQEKTGDLTIGIVGHSYLLYDSYLEHESHQEDSQARGRRHHSRDGLASQDSKKRPKPSQTALLELPKGNLRFRLSSCAAEEHRRDYSSAGFSLRPRFGNGGLYRTRSQKGRSSADAGQHR